MTTLLTGFFALQGAILDASLLFAVAVITAGLIIQDREKRQEKRLDVEEVLCEADRILSEGNHASR